MILLFHVLPDSIEAYNSECKYPIQVTVLQQTVNNFIYNM